MATGVRSSEVVKAATRVVNYQDSHFSTAHDPVPSGLDGETVSSRIIDQSPCGFVRVEAGRAAPAELLSNAFLLADNGLGLTALANSAETARLIYMDPPYGTGADFQSRDQSHAYSDWDISDESLAALRERLELCWDVLAGDGSIYVHIGHQLVGQVKVMLDSIFGYENFRNLITRRKCSSKNFTKKTFSNIHDYVLFYTKSKNYVWNQPTIEPDGEWIDREYPKVDKIGRYKLVPIHAPGARRGETGKAWKGRLPPPGKHWQYAPSTLDELDARGEIHWSRNGNPRRKVYLGEQKRVALTDYWPEFRDAHHQSVHTTGYPTEKNGEMLRMIVRASTEAGDLVVDPFCGSGSTLEAADLEGRRWIGMDRSFEAARCTLARLHRGTAPIGDFVGTNKIQGDGEVRCAAQFDFLADARLLAHHRAELFELENATRAASQR